MKNIIKILFASLLIAIFFTIGDALVHFFIPFLEINPYATPDKLVWLGWNPLIWYSLGKLIGTFIMSFIALFILEFIKIPFFLKSLILTIGIVIILEIRYILLELYSFSWHIFNSINHFIWLYLLSTIIIYLFWKPKKR